MSERSWPLDPTRPVIALPDARLQRLMLNDPSRCASINEYCRATGINPIDIMGFLSGAINEGLISLESVGGEVFIHTAPLGRVNTGVQVPPNLWEMLRRNGDTTSSFKLWRFVRELEFGGWEVEVDSKKIPNIDSSSPVAVRIGAYILPLLLLPTTDDIASLNGPLSKFARKGYPLVGVICEKGLYEDYATSIRGWILNRDATVDLDILLMERPMYQPILIRTRDKSINPRSINRREIEDVFFDADNVKGIDPRDKPSI